VNEQFASEKADTLKDVMAAVLKASRWLDDRAHRPKAATTLAPAEYVNAPAQGIEGRLEGKYKLGSSLGTKTFRKDFMAFYRGGQVNPPRRAHARWFLAQYQRLGLVDGAPNYELADAVLLRDLYEDVAAAEKIDVPDDDMASFTVKLDQATFDPQKPEEEAKRP